MKTFQTTFLVAMLLMLCSCANKEQTRILDDVRTYISDNPELALETLDSLSATGSIRGREGNARFALLYSMALDKNGIDSVDDSLINVAVKWYSRHGNADERLKSYYYYGRICQNAGNNEAAMESFVKAEQYVGKAGDHVAAGLLYDAMSNIAMDIFDMEKVLEYCRKAEAHYKKAGDRKRYAYALLGLAVYFTVDGQYGELSSVLDSVRMSWDIIDTLSQNSYYQLRLGEFKETGQYKKLKAGLEEYITEFPREKINWMSVSEFYLTLGEKRLALEALKTYREINRNYMNEPSYYIHESNAYDSLGILDSALAAYKKYQNLTDSLDMVILEQDTKFLQERYAKDKMIAEAKYRMAIIILSSVMAFLILAYVIYTLHNRIKKRENEKRKVEEELSGFRRQYADLEREKAGLEKIIAGNPPVDRQSKKVLDDRLELLNRFFAAEITSNTSADHTVSHELSRLVEDRGNFMYATRMTFAAAHPKFIRMLEDKGLTEHEIEYCCLYAIGLSGKEIGIYVDKKRHYSESSTIRKKLGLGEHDTNLGLYLRKLLAKDN